MFFQDSENISESRATDGHRIFFFNIEKKYLGKKKVNKKKCTIEDPSLNWLASESGSQKSLRDFFLPSSLLTTVEYKIDHNSKTKNRTKKLQKQKLRSEHCASFEI